jgi:hypothetical protein
MLSMRSEEMTDRMMTVIDFDSGRLRQAKRALRKIKLRRRADRG